MALTTGEMTVGEISRLHEVFVEIGELKLEDFKFAYKKVLGSGLDDYILKLTFELIDTDDDGVVVWEDFQQHLAALRRDEQLEEEFLNQKEFFHEKCREIPSGQKELYHSAPIKRIMYQPRMDIFYTCGLDGSVRTWNGSDLQYRSTLHYNTTGSVDFDHDPLTDTLVVADTDNVVSLYSTTGGKLLKSFKAGRKSLAEHGLPDQVHRQQFRLPLRTPTKGKRRLASVVADDDSASPSPKPKLTSPGKSNQESVTASKTLDRYIHGANHALMQRMWANERKTEPLNVTMLPETTAEITAVSGCPALVGGPKAGSIYAANLSSFITFMGLEDGAVHGYKTRLGGKEPSGGSRSDTAGSKKDDNTLLPLFTWNLHSKRVTCIRADPVAETVVTSSMDSDIHILSMERGIVLRTLKGTSIESLRSHSHGVRYFEYPQHPKIIGSWGNERFAILWDPTVGKPLQTLHGHVARIVDMKFSPENEKLIFTYSEDRAIRIWDIRTFRCVQQIRERPWETLGAPMSIFYHKKHDALITGTHRLYWKDAVKQTFADGYCGHTRAILGTGVCEKEQLLASCDEISLRVWNSNSDTLTVWWPMSPIHGICMDARGHGILVDEGSSDLSVISSTNGHQVMFLTDTKKFADVDGHDPRFTFWAEKNMWVVGTSRSILFFPDSADHKTVTYPTAAFSRSLYLKAFISSLAVAGQRLVVGLNDGNVTSLPLRYLKHHSDERLYMFQRIGEQKGKGAADEKQNARKRRMSMSVRPRASKSAPSTAANLSDDEDDDDVWLSVLPGPLHRGVRPMVQASERFQTMLMAKRRGETSLATGVGSVLGEEEDDDVSGIAEPESDVKKSPKKKKSSGLQQIDAFGSRIESISILTSQLVVSSDGHGMLTIWDVPNAEELFTWSAVIAPKVAILSTDTTPDGTSLFYGDELGYVGCFDMTALLHLAEGGGTTTRGFSAFSESSDVSSSQSPGLTGLKPPSRPTSSSGNPFGSAVSYRRRIRESISRTSLFRVLDGSVAVVKWIAHRSLLCVGSSDTTLLLVTPTGERRSCLGQNKIPEPPEESRVYTTALSMFRKEMIMNLVESRGSLSLADIIEHALVRSEILFPDSATVRSTIDEMSPSDLVADNARLLELNEETGQFSVLLINTVFQTKSSLGLAGAGTTTTGGGTTVVVVPPTRPTVQDGAPPDSIPLGEGLAPPEVNAKDDAVQKVWTVTDTALDQPVKPKPFRRRLAAHGRLMDALRRRTVEKRESLLSMDISLFGAENLRRGSGLFSTLPPGQTLESFRQRTQSVTSDDFEEGSMSMSGDEEVTPIAQVLTRNTSVVGAEPVPTDFNLDSFQSAMAAGDEQTTPGGLQRRKSSVAAIMGTSPSFRHPKQQERVDSMHRRRSSLYRRPAGAPQSPKRRSDTETEGTEGDELLVQDSFASVTSTVEEGFAADSTTSVLEFMTFLLDDEQELREEMEMEQMTDVLQFVFEEVEIGEAIGFRSICKAFLEEKKYAVYVYEPESYKRSQLEVREEEAYEQLAEQERHAYLQVLKTTFGHSLIRYVFLDDVLSPEDILHRLRREGPGGHLVARNPHLAQAGGGLNERTSSMIAQSPSSALSGSVSFGENASPGLAKKGSTASAASPTGSTDASPSSVGSSAALGKKTKSLLSSMTSSRLAAIGAPLKIKRRPSSCTTRDQQQQQGRRSAVHEAMMSRASSTEKYLARSDDPQHRSYLAAHWQTTAATIPFSATNDVLRWSAAAEQLIEAIPLGDGSSDRRPLRFRSLMHEFKAECELHVKTIVADLGQVAGARGIKHIDTDLWCVGGIGIHCVTNPTSGLLCGSLMLCSKLASLELEGLGAFTQAQQRFTPLRIHAPLACVVRYVGLTFFCSAVLPCLKTAIVPSFSRDGLVASVAHRHAFGALKLDPIVRPVSTPEGYREYVSTSGSLYAVGFRSLFPPQWNTSEDPTYPIHLLRKELVKSGSNSLSSGCYAPHIPLSERSREAKETTKAARRINVLIDEAAKELSKADTSVVNYSQGVLVDLLHKKGLNARHLLAVAFALERILRDEARSKGEVSASEGASSMSLGRSARNHATYSKDNGPTVVALKKRTSTPDTQPQQHRSASRSRVTSAVSIAHGQLPSQQAIPRARSTTPQVGRRSVVRTDTDDVDATAKRAATICSQRLAVVESSLAELREAQEGSVDNPTMPRALHRMRSSAGKEQQTTRIEEPMGPTLVRDLLYVEVAARTFRAVFFDYLRRGVFPTAGLSAPGKIGTPSLLSPLVPSGVPGAEGVPTTGEIIGSSPKLHSPSINNQSIFSPTVAGMGRRQSMQSPAIISFRLPTAIVPSGAGGKDHRPPSATGGSPSTMAERRRAAITAALTLLADLMNPATGKDIWEKQLAKLAAQKFPHFHQHRLLLYDEVAGQPHLATRLRARIGQLIGLNETQGDLVPVSKTMKLEFNTEMGTLQQTALLEEATAAVEAEHRIAVNMGGDKSPELIKYSNLQLQLALQRVQRAGVERTVLEGLHHQAELFGRGSIPVAMTLAKHAQLFLTAGFHHTAASHLRESRQLLAQAVGQAHPLAAHLLNSLSDVMDQLGLHIDTVRCREEAMEKQKEAITNGEYTAICGKLDLCDALYLVARGQLEFKNTPVKLQQARSLLQQRFDLLTSTVDPNSAMCLSALRDLAMAHGHIGEEIEGIQILDWMAKDAAQRYGPHSPQVAALQDDIGMLYVHRQEYDAAHNVFQFALSLRLRAFGSTEKLAVSYRMLALLATKRGLNKEAVTLLSQACKLLDRAPCDDEEVVSTFGELGAAQQATGQLGAAIGSWSKALDGRERVYGALHPLSADVMFNIASLFFAEGKFHEAWHTFEICCQIRSKLYGPRHPIVAMTKSHLARCEASLGDIVGAVRTFQEALRIHSDHCEQYADDAASSPRGSGRASPPPTTESGSPIGVLERSRSFSDFTQNSSHDRTFPLMRAQLLSNMGSLLLADAVEIWRRRKAHGGAQPPGDLQCHRMKDIAVDAEKELLKARRYLQEAHRLALAATQEPSHSSVLLLDGLLKEADEVIVECVAHREHIIRDSDKAKLVHSWSALTEGSPSSAGGGGGGDHKGGEEGGGTAGSKVSLIQRSALWYRDSHKIFKLKTDFGAM